MKNSAQVLSHIVHQPQYKKLVQHQCINAIKALFPPHIQAMVSLAYVKHKVLFFVLTHPGAKQEFDIIISSIKTPLKQYPPPKCQELDFEDIRAYVSHKPLQKEQTCSQETVPYYKEQSKGNFNNSVADPKLHKIIEKIRKAIESSSDDR